MHYPELAGDAAAATYANDEAIASYRLALELFSEEPGLATEAVSLWLKLGALFWRLGDYSEGRAALGEAAARSPAGAPLLEARCYRWLGQLEIEDCRDEDAFAALDKAEEVLQACSDKNTDDWVENWLDLQLSRSNLHYWRNETQLQGTGPRRARPVVEARAGPWKKADYAVHVAGNRWRARRFAVDDKTIEDVTAARQVVADAGLKIEEFHWHTLGSLLLLYGDLGKARRELEGALDAARRAGDKSLELANLVFLAWSHLRQHDVAGTEKIVQAGSELVRSRTFPSAGMVKALQSWVEWKLGCAAQAERTAIEALDQWRPNMVRYPFCAICLWPLIAVRLAEGRHAAAVEAARELLRPATNAISWRAGGGCGPGYLGMGQRGRAGGSTSLETGPEFSAGTTLRLSVLRGPVAKLRANFVQQRRHGRAGHPGHDGSVDRGPQPAQRWSIGGDDRQPRYQLPVSG